MSWPFLANFEYSKIIFDRGLGVENIDLNQSALMQIQHSTEYRTFCMAFAENGHFKNTLCTSILHSRYVRNLEHRTHAVQYI